MSKKQLSVKDRLKVIQAATQLFNEKGVKRTTFAAIAALSGVAADSIKAEFRYKTVLALAVQTEQLEKVKQEYLVSMPDASPQDAIKFILRARVEFAHRSKDRVKMFFVKSIQGVEPWSGMLDQLIWQLSIEFVSIMERGVREGFFEKGADINVAVRTITSAYLIGLSTVGFRRDAFDIEEVWDFIEPQIDMVMAAISKN
jgi:AcrR family transcriptional regulator